ncbi:hypothetical protein KJ359_004001 [Pestalotiopsis sp. 9143b]|nr:hypothetical protein KJ359_004001 [Pestalotiopsis sp. 9143b]
MTSDKFHLQFPIPEELRRIPDGSSVSEADAVLAENGRTYHGYKEGRYFLSNDPMFVMALDCRLALTPMTSSPSTVLDIGTGTGIWVIQFAEQNPSSHVVGIDLSAIQPSNKPDNCEFIKTDAEGERSFPRLPKFDYIHLRLVCMAFANPKLVLRRAWDNLAPGGIGQYMYTDLYEGVRGAGWKLLRGMGWSPEQVEDLVARFKIDSGDENYRVFYRM